MRTYLFGVAEESWSVEVQQVALAQLTVDHLPLLVQPASGRIMPPLEHNMITLQSTGKVIPGRRNQSIFSLQILDYLVGGSLEEYHVSLGIEMLDASREETYALSGRGFATLHRL